jgi:hypothetical protein
MICYKDRTFCASEVKEHTCGRELTEEDKIDAKMRALPIAYGYFCEINPCGKPHNNGEESCNECLTIKEGI